MVCIEENKYTNELIYYYNEGDIRNKRRILLLNQIMEYVVFENHYDATMSEISVALNVERKTIYRYFDTKDDILIDLAYLLVTYNNQKYLEISNKILNDKNVKDKDKFSCILRSVTKFMVSNRKELNFLAFFDDRFNILDEHSNPKERYRNLITGFKTKNHYLRPIILFLDREKLLDKDLKKEDIIEVGEQLMNSFVSRTLKKEKESYRFDIKNIDIAIKILGKGILKK